MAYCPNCQQTFAEGGFCPFDGTGLLNEPPERSSATLGAVRPAGEPPPPRAPSEPNVQVATEPGFSSPRELAALSALSASGGDAGAALRALRDQDPKAEYERLVGTTLDNRYKIEKKLGEGGMGVVFLARHTIIEKLVAIKVLKREVARDHSVVKRFVQEAKAASRIGHPNIVDVTDFGTTPDGMTYSVMEFVEGDTLSQVIKQAAPMELSRVLPIVAQLAKALGAAHQKGIVHRDLKPENVFLIDRDGRPDFVKVVDFGIAKVMPLESSPSDGPRLTRAGTVFGTPEYMAPEQAAGRSDTDQRVDIYALGTILYEMIVGKVPHKGPTMVRTLAMQMLDPIPPPRKTRPDLDISPEFEAVLLKALAKKREDRYPDMETFLVELEKVAGGVPLSIPLSPKSAPISALARKPEPGGVPRAAAGDRTMVEAGAEAVLPKLPPGADPAKLGADAAPTTAAPRRKRPVSKIDPAFLEGRPAFDHVFEDPPAPNPSGSRLPIILGVVVLLCAGAAGAYWLSRSGAEPDRQQPVATPESGRVDAARPSAGAMDADIPLAAAVDASVAVVDTPPDARRRVRHVWRRADAAVRIRRGDVTIRVQSEPDGAIVRIDGVYRGKAVGRGLNLSMPYGSKVRVTCVLPGYQNRDLVVMFDNQRTLYECKLIRPKCVKGLKNPFDECPD